MYFELAEQLNMIIDRYWGIYQWWTSISIGLLLVAHFASKNLNIFSLSFLLLLYFIYTIWNYQMMSYNLGLMNGYYEELQVLRDAGETSPVIAAYLNGNEGAIYGFISSGMLLFGTTSYLIYMFVRSNRSAA